MSAFKKIISLTLCALVLMTTFAVSSFAATGEEATAAFYYYNFITGQVECFKEVTGLTTNDLVKDTLISLHNEIYQNTNNILKFPEGTEYTTANGNYKLGSTASDRLNADAFVAGEFYTINGNANATAIKATWKSIAAPTTSYVKTVKFVAGQNLFFINATPTLSYTVKYFDFGETEPTETTYDVTMQTNLASLTNNDKTGIPSSFAITKLNSKTVTYPTFTGSDANLYCYELFLADGTSLGINATIPTSFKDTAELASYNNSEIKTIGKTFNLRIKLLDPNAGGSNDVTVTCDETFSIGSQIDISANTYSSKTQKNIAFSAFVADAGAVGGDIFRGYEIEQLYFVADEEKTNLIEKDEFTFTPTGEDFADYMDASGSFFSLEAKVKPRKCDVTIYYAPAGATIEAAEGKITSSGKNDTYKVLVTKTVDFSSQAISVSTILSQDDLEKINTDIPAGWDLDPTCIDKKINVDPDNVTEVIITYSMQEIPVFVDYNNGKDFESVYRQAKLGTAYKGYELIDESEDADANKAIITAKLKGFSSITTCNVTEDSDPKADDQYKPSRDWEYVGYEVYHVNVTGKVNDISDLDGMEFLNGVNNSGTNAAEPGTVVVVKIIWKNDADFLLKIYNTNNDLAIAVGKNLKIYYWANNKPCKRKEIIKVNDPDTNYVVMLWPAMETVNADVDNPSKVFTLRMLAGTRSNLNMDVRIAFYKTLIETIKGLT
ncbi:MAG: hypothetical protein K6B52_04305 [Clostridiales bacterium]|nr:hypothetical protein [Clostridiales bacterium]